MIPISIIGMISGGVIQAGDPQCTLHHQSKDVGTKPGQGACRQGASGQEYSDWKNARKGNASKENLSWNQQAG